MEGAPCTWLAPVDGGDQQYENINNKVHAIAKVCVEGRCQGREVGCLGQEWLGQGSMMDEEQVPRERGDLPRIPSGHVWPRPQVGSTVQEQWQPMQKMDMQLCVRPGQGQEGKRHNMAAVTMGATQLQP